VDSDRQAVAVDRAMAVAMARDRRGAGIEWDSIERELTQRLGAEVAAWALGEVGDE